MQLNLRDIVGLFLVLSSFPDKVRFQRLRHDHVSHWLWSCLDHGCNPIIGVNEGTARLVVSRNSGFLKTRIDFRPAFLR
jgi:hypothetical protein